MGRFAFGVSVEREKNKNKMTLYFFKIMFKKVKSFVFNVMLLYIENNKIECQRNILC